MKIFFAGFAIGFLLTGLLVVFSYPFRSVHKPHRHRHRSNADEFIFYINGQRSYGMTPMKASQVANMKVKAADRFGNEVGSLDAPPVWELDKPEMGSMSVAEDGMSAQFVPAGGLGDVQVMVSGFSGGKALSGSEVLSVSAGDAEQLAISVEIPA